MKILEICDWKIKVLLITAKTHMLASYIDPKVPKDFCDILTWQITRKLVFINSLSRTPLWFYKIWFPLKVPFQNLQSQIPLTNFRTYPKDFFREPLDLQAICKPADWQITKNLKVFLRIKTANSPSQ